MYIKQLLFSVIVGFLTIGSLLNAKYEYLSQIGNGSMLYNACNNNSERTVPNNDVTEGCDALESTFKDLALEGNIQGFEIGADEWHLAILEKHGTTGLEVESHIKTILKQDQTDKRLLQKQTNAEYLRFYALKNQLITTRLEESISKQ